MYSEFLIAVGELSGMAITGLAIGGGLFLLLILAVLSAFCALWVR